MDEFNKTEALETEQDVVNLFSDANDLVEVATEDTTDLDDLGALPEEGFSMKEKAMLGIGGVALIGAAAFGIKKAIDHHKAKKEEKTKIKKKLKFRLPWAIEEEEVKETPVTNNTPAPPIDANVVENKG